MDQPTRRVAAFATLALATSLLCTAPVAADTERAAAGTADVTAQLGYAIPAIDLDFESFGGLPVTIGAGYAVVDRLLLGVRGRFDYVLLDTDADLHLWIIDAAAWLGCFVWRGLQPFLALGATIVGDSYLGDVRHDPYFGMAVGISYTFYLTSSAAGALGLEAGLELAMMFDDGFKRTETKAGTLTDSVFAYPLVFVGVRFSTSKAHKSGEVANDG
jgi:hypothetical protein